ncbi:HU family DNA-binding protein [Treponema zioleckii]|uniref:HU family DNA-binding protein n=1 Tax=Treponema zioleckii TaxID=331680 RepID=UPI00168B802D|nr:HU family DNA-binding protein [Treponema zioleckii]
MNKSELVDAIAKDTGLTKKDSEAALKSFIENVSKAVESGDDVQLIGFGTFTTATRAERTGRNPSTGKEITIPASKSPKFKPGKAFKDRVNK